jgi:hypothetical protein
MQKYICSKIDPIIMIEFNTLTENPLKITLYRFQILEELWFSVQEWVFVHNCIIYIWVFVQNTQYFLFYIQILSYNFL